MSFSQRNPAQPSCHREIHQRISRWHELCAGFLYFSFGFLDFWISLFLFVLDFSISLIHMQNLKLSKYFILVGDIVHFNRPMGYMYSASTCTSFYFAVNINVHTGLLHVCRLVCALQNKIRKSRQPCQQKHVLMQAKNDI